MKKLLVLSVLIVVFAMACSFAVLADGKAGKSPSNSFSQSAAWGGLPYGDIGVATTDTDGDYSADGIIVTGENVGSGGPNPYTFPESPHTIFYVFPVFPGSVDRDAEIYMASSILNLYTRIFSVFSISHQNHSLSVPDNNPGFEDIN